MDSARLQYRKAQLAAKRNAQLAEQHERELLLGGGSGRSTPDGKRRATNQKLSYASFTFVPLMSLS
jgi:hypothetical protein